MENDELVRFWKDPEAREAAVTDHPSGEIRAGESTRALRRAALLTGLGGLAAGAALFASQMTVTSVSGPA
ncbi:hypothetical protein P3T37_000975 [Kitasatospora sp. MAA4]|uniref:hypothetical protein n=1 Tax=Kitasatospora sp. MAA4 TaxID=3035093 RepID=UPI00247327DE|nr:hypothetical protein [Kitasatospora sp. MAA4]MDH6131601.1 hypothetical protein [Kitasatospora sp. MAA4]